MAELGFPSIVLASFYPETHPGDRMSSIRSSASSEMLQRRALLDEKDIESRIQSYYSSRKRQWTTSWYVVASLVLLLTASLVANIYLVLDRDKLGNLLDSSRRTAADSVVQREPSKYANLVAEVELPFEWATEYASPDMSIAGPLWDSINFNGGLVALDYNYTDAIGLPRAQKFPWDHDKGLYLLNGFHNLHCLKSIHLSLREYMENKPQTRPVPHIMHCMDSLRADVYCRADDTPRYTTTSKSPESGVGQLRQCRDWNKLVEWAKERDSCYDYINAGADHVNQFERFKYCDSPDSPYWPKIREHFNKPDDWFPREGEVATES